MSVSLLTIRRALGRALDDLGVYTLTTVASGVLTAIGLTDLSTGASTSRYDSAWVYVATGTVRGQQRRVKTNGFTPATGALTLALGMTIPTIGDEIEVTRLFPAAALVPPEDTSYVALINRGLAKLAVRDSVALSTTAGTYSYSTVAWPWLDRTERLGGVREPDAVGALTVPADWRGVTLRLDAQTPALEVRMPYTGTLTLDVIRPANTWIKVGSTWGESTAGLADDTDETMASLEDAVAVGLAEAYQVLANRSPARPNGPWLDKWAAQREIVQSLQSYDRTQQMVAAPAAAGAA